LKKDPIERLIFLSLMYGRRQKGKWWFKRPETDITLKAGDGIGTRNEVTVN
jgi:hypothetical protein